MSETATAFIYLHVHWDREWYLPFEIYRARLVAVVRQVIESLKDGSLPNFLLDGQASVLEDVLEIEPALQGPISQLMQAGQLCAGPWYVLADQMLVGGESLIRNLQFGLEITEKFGPPAMIGYCPDTFGHSADLPRILNGFGIDNAYVWRGVPKLNRGPVFYWRSPDGSKVLTYQLSRGYYRTEFHFLSTPQELAERLQSWLTVDSAHFCQALNGALIPVGADHLAPPTNLYKLAQTQSNLSFVTLGQFTLRLQSLLSEHDDVPLIDGELRDNSAALQFERAYMLAGVLSTRLYLKRANRLAEHRLSAILEPLFVQLSIEEKIAYPQSELRHAWKLLLQNHPHDSICGCSVDVVHEEMQMRTTKFHQLLDALDGEATRAILSARQGCDYPLIAIMTGDDKRSHCFPADCSLIDPTVPIDSVQIFNLSGQMMVAPVPVTWACEEETSAHALSDEHGQTNLQIDTVEKSMQIFCGTGGEPSVKEVFVHKGWVWTEALPPFGYKILPWPIKCGEAQRSPTTPAKRHGHTVVAHPRHIANEFLSLKVESDGSLCITCRENRQIERVFRLTTTIRDVADCGDTYNFDPLPDDQPLLASFVDTSEGLQGPLVSSLILKYELEIPLSLNDLEPLKGDGVPEAPGKYQRSQETARHFLALEVSLRRGVPIVFFDLVWTNKSRDHRLEIVLDTGSEIERTYAENHFSLLPREANVPVATLPVGKGEEAPLDRFPCQRFFIANGQVFFNCGMPEYAVDGTAVCLTVARCVSYLSRPRLVTRGGGAGPSVATPQANCLGEQRSTYGWAPLKSLPSPQAREQLPDEHGIQAYALAEIFEGKFWSTFTRSPQVPESKSFVALDNPSFRLLGSYLKEGHVVLRILNVSSSKQTAVMKLNFPCRRAYLCTLNEQAVEQGRLQQDKEQITIQAGANELLTVKVELIR